MRFKTWLFLSELEVREHEVLRVKQPSTIRKIRLYKTFKPPCPFRNYTSMERRQFQNCER